MSKKQKTKSVTTIRESTLQWILAVAAILLYIQTLPYGYTLDDEIFILKNTTVQQGLSGIYDLFVNGSLSDFGIQPYRPVTLSSFALEKSLFGDASGIRHFVNISAYVVLLLLLFKVIRRLFSELNPVYAAAIVFLFAAHPLHTEAVSSVKGRDELFAAIFAMLAWLQFIKRDAGYKALATGTLFFGLSCFSKESGIVFLAIIPLADLLFISKDFRRSIILSIPLAVMAAGYLFCRQTVNGGIVVDTDIPIMANILNATDTAGELWATRAVLLFYYVKLLFVPWPLTWDYSFNQIPVHSWSDALPWISLAIYLSLFFFAIIRRRKDPVLVFCILFFLIASLPTNNLLFRTGSTMGERFLFIPSIAFCIAVVHLLLKWSHVDQRTEVNLRALKGFTPFLLLLSVFSLVTVARNPDWRNNLTLFESGVKGSPNSTRTHYSLASEYMRLAPTKADIRERNELLAKAREHFEKSIAIYPDNYQALYNAGICYSLSGDTTKAIDCYLQTIRLNPKYLTAMNNLGVLYQNRLEFDNAEKYFGMAFRIDSTVQVGKDNLANLYYNKGIWLSMSKQNDEAIASYRKSLNYAPGNIMSLNNIASLYANRSLFDSSLVYLKRAHSIRPNDLFIIENIAAVSFLNKEYDQAEAFARKGLQLDPSAAKSQGVLRDLERTRK